MAKAPAKKKRTRGKGATSTGRGGGQLNADQTNWLTKVQNHRLKFDTIQKGIFLEILQNTGLKGVAAEAAETTTETVRRHLKNDPDFKEAYDAAWSMYTDSIRHEVQRRGAKGVLRPLYHSGRRQLDVVADEDGNAKRDKNGDVILVPASILEFSDRLLELEAKRVDPEYRDKATVDMTNIGGVIVAPADMTPEEWVAREEELNKTLEPPEGVEDKTIEGELG